MPGSSKTQQRAEAKYNVTTDFPRLDLHSAAASGNLGLVKFALSHGQPINSVLDGVLPLHAASAGGDAVVVDYLIDAGADVNAPRLPRRYSNEKSRNATGPIVGTSGSTPLHFAAANGHIEIARILLDRGAHPNRADKHGITPEKLARDNGWIDCAELIKGWIVEREGDLPPIPYDRDLSGDTVVDSIVVTPPPSNSKRVQVKRSIDNALYLLKSSAGNALRSDERPLPPSPSSASFQRGPPSPGYPPPLGEYSFYPTPAPSPDDVPAPRRPSLPHLFSSPPESPFLSQHRIPRSPRRPRSAGTGAEQQQDSPTPGCPSRKLSSKYSLLGLFKKANQSGGDSDCATPDTSMSTDTSQAPPLPPLPSSPGFKIPNSPPNRTTSPDDSSSSPPDTPPTALSSTGRFRSRFGGEFGTHSPLGVSAVELHHSISRDHLLDRSNSATPLTPSGEQDEDPVTRPSILRHNRSSSSQSSTNGPPSSKTLRFDSPTSTEKVLSLSRRTSKRQGQGHARIGSLSPARSVLRGSTSVGSLRCREESSGRGSEAEGRTASPVQAPVSAPAQHTEFDQDGEGDVADAEQNLMQGSGVPIAGRLRGRSFASSSSSLSPGLSPGDNVTSKSFATEFPFSIDTPPPTSDSPVENSSRLTVPRRISHSKLNDSRLRGDSVSSMDTDASANLQSSMTSGTSSSKTDVATPLPSPNLLSQPISVPLHGLRAAIYTHHEQDSPTSSLEDLDLSTRPFNSLRHTSSNLNKPHRPVDIRKISNRAEAEALVQQTEKEILELAHVQPDDMNGGAGEIGGGDIEKVPLSARLAAYGEILALERRFAKGEKQREQWAARSDSEDDVVSQPPVPQSATLGREGFGGSRRNETPMSLAKSSVVSSRLPRPGLKTPRMPRRPHTAEGGTRTEWKLPSDEGINGQRRPTHAQSRSTSNPVGPDVSPIREKPPMALPAIEPPKPTTHPSKTSHLRLLSHHSNPSLRPLPVKTDTEPPVPTIGLVGVPLTRTSTAPLQETQSNITKNERSRHIASANKLARMGFSVSDSPQMTGLVTQPPIKPAQKQRFGGIKSLMQSLKGKS